MLRSAAERQSIRVLLVGACLIAIPFTSLVAAEGRIPIWQPIVIGPGAEGKYVVTRDIQANPGLPVIDIQPGTVAVDIDLNGFTLFGSNANVIQARQADNVTIRNGSIHFGSDGIRIEGCRKAVVEDVKVEFVEGIGINLYGAFNFAVRRSIVVSDAGAGLGGLGGILADGTYPPLQPSIPIEGMIEDNQVRGTVSGIALINGSSVSIRNNRVEETFQGDGIRLNNSSGCQVADNTVQEAGQIGIVLELSPVNRIIENVVVASGADGIALLNSDDNLVLNNVSSRNAGNGLMTANSLRNAIDRNTLNFNGLAGLWLDAASTDNCYGRNLMRANIAPPSFCVLTPAVPCGAPDLCIDGPMNSTFSDNMAPGPGC